MNVGEPRESHTPFIVSITLISFPKRPDPRPRSRMVLTLSGVFAFQKATSSSFSYAIFGHSSICILLY